MDDDTTGQDEDGNHEPPAAGGTYGGATYGGAWAGTASPSTATPPPSPPDPTSPTVAPTPPRTSLWGSSPDPFDAPRPTPSLGAMVGVGAGLLVVAGLFSLLAELDSYDQRGVGLTISFIFLVLGVALSTINRSTRSANAGVAISALAVIPLTVFLFANADVFSRFSDGDFEGGNPYDGLRGVVTLMLLAAAALWLLGYILGPGRRYGFYLGAALLAIWLIPMAWIQISAIEDQFAAFDTFDSSTTFDSDFGSDSTFDSGSDFGSSSDEFGSSSDEFGQTDPFDTFDEPDTFDTFDEPDITDPSTKLGVLSLVFGTAYLVFAAWRDRRRDARMATAVLVPALIILLYSLSLLGGHIGWVGESVLGIAIGGAILAVGIRGGRRLSSWLGVFVATVGVGSIVVQGLQDSPRAAGGVLTVLGVVIALLVGRTEERPSTPDTGAIPATDPGSDPADGTGAPPPSDPTFGLPPTPPVYDPSGTAAPSFAPPTFTPPTAPPGPDSGAPQQPPWSQPF